MKPMESSNQKAFISRIRRALGHEPDRRRNARQLFSSGSEIGAAAILARIRNRTPSERRRLLDRLVEMAEPICLHVHIVKDPPSAAANIADLVREKDPEWGPDKRIAAWRHPLIESLNLPAVLKDQGIPVYFTGKEENEAVEPVGKTYRERLRQQIIDAYMGVTSADFCMAETATLVMRTRPGQARSVSLVPSIHIAVIHLSQIIADLKELYALVKTGSGEAAAGLSNCMTFISGPSKTADVEATMVHGAHGPREVHVYVISE